MTAACSLEATPLVFVLPVDAGQHAIRPVLPKDPCGRPRAKVVDALNGLDFSVVGEFSYHDPAS